MIHDFCVYHRSEQGQKSPSLPTDHWALDTCLRSLVFTEHGEARPQELEGYRRFKGGEAFSLVLQIVCGLHSPLVGETEVFGQFKNFIRDSRDHLPPGLLQVLELVVQEAKKVRAQHLQGLGCTSYGSLLRKHLQGQRAPLVFLGAGSLTRDILPWCVKDGSEIRLLTRRPDHHQDLKQDKVKILSYQDAGQLDLRGAVVVIAAPLSAVEISRLLPLAGVKQVFDLRGESETDPLAVGSVIPLQAFFQDLSENRRRAERAKASALEEIEVRSTHLQLMERPRPFGWEDLCSYS